MKYHYPASFDVDNSFKIKKVFIPDLDYSFDPDEKLPEECKSSVSYYIGSRIEKDLKENRLEFKLPKKLSFYSKSFLPQANRDINMKKVIWTTIEVEFNPIIAKKMVCKKIVPAVGIIANLTTALCLSLTALISVQLTTGNENESVKNMNITGSVIYFFVYIMIFMKSGAIENLGHVGEKLDTFICERGSCRIRSDDYKKIHADLPVRTTQHKIVITCSAFLISIMLLTNALIGAITTYQSTVALGKKAEESVSPYINEAKATVLALVLTITNTIDTLAFQGSFGKLLIKSVDNYLFRYFHQSHQERRGVQLELPASTPDDSAQRNSLTLK